MLPDFRDVISGGRLTEFVVSEFETLRAQYVVDGFLYFLDYDRLLGHVGELLLVITAEPSGRQSRVNCTFMQDRK